MSEPVEMQDVDAANDFEIGAPTTAASIPYRGTHRYEHIYEQALALRRGQALPVHFSAASYAEVGKLSVDLFLRRHHDARFRTYQRGRTLWIERLLD
jgi:hypothetical protein